MTAAAALFQQIPVKEIGWAGIIVPAIVFAISFAVTYALYKHFSKITK